MVRRTSRRCGQLSKESWADEKLVVKLGTQVRWANFSPGWLSQSRYLPRNDVSPYLMKSRQPGLEGINHDVESAFRHRHSRIPKQPSLQRCRDVVLQPLKFDAHSNYRANLFPIKFVVMSWVQSLWRYANFDIHFMGSFYNMSSSGLVLILCFFLFISIYNVLVSWMMSSVQHSLMSLGFRWRSSYHRGRSKQPTRTSNDWWINLVVCEHQKTRHNPVWIECILCVVPQCEGLRCCWYECHDIQKKHPVKTDAE